MYKIKRMAALRSLLVGMERDVGMNDLNSGQRDIYYAAQLVSDEHKDAHGDDMRNHPILSEMPRSTFFSLIKGLITNGYLNHKDGPRSGTYTILK